MLAHPVRFVADLCLSALVLMPVLSACNFAPHTETSVPGAVETSAAQTISANMQQETIAALEAQLTAQAKTLMAPVPSLSQAPPPSAEPTRAAPPTAAPVETPIPPAATFPPPTAAQPTQVLMLTANIETRCRQGPNPAFPVVSYIRVGQQAPLIGRNPESTWWLIHDPQGQFGNCWVWGQTTEVLGDSSRVPVVQPPPLPTQPSSVSFTAAYNTIRVCSGVERVVFLVQNTGGVSFQSSNISILDITHNTGLSGPESSNNPFLGSPTACGAGGPFLPAGAYSYVAKGIGFLPASGTKGRGVIVLCTETNLGGVCVEQHANFVFP